MKGLMELTKFCLQVTQTTVLLASLDFSWDLASLPPCAALSLSALRASEYDQLLHSCPSSAELLRRFPLSRDNKDLKMQRWRGIDGKEMWSARLPRI